MAFIGWVIVAIVPWTPSYSQDAEEKPQEAEEREIPERGMVSSGLDSANLALAYPGQAVWLESERSGRGFALFEPEQTARAEGALLLLADEGQSANAGLAGAIRAHFGEAGWASMTLGLPAMPLALEQARRERRGQPAMADKEEDGETEAEAEAAPASIMIDVMDSDELDKMEADYRAGVQAHLVAAVGDLTERGYSRLVLVGVGRGAAHMISLADKGPAKPAALVMITPEFEADEQASMFASLKAAQGLPVLDIVSSRPGRPVARKRQSRMKREGVTGYQQQAAAIGARPLPRDAQGLANRITAWLQPRD